MLGLFYAAGQQQLAKAALNEQGRAAGNWLSNNLDQSLAKTKSNAEDLLLLAQDEIQAPQTTAVGLKRAFDDFFAMQAEEQAATAGTLVSPSKRLCLRKVL